MHTVARLGKKSFIIAAPIGDTPVPKHFRALAERLAEEEHRVLLIVDGKRDDLVDCASNPAVYTWPSRRPTRLIDGNYLATIIRRYKPDCIVANFGAVNTSMVIGWIYRVPVRIAWRHTLSSQIAIDSSRSRLNQLFLSYRKGRVYRLCTHIAANAFATKEDLVLEHRIPASRVVVWPNGMVDPGINPIPRSQRKDIVCVGRLDRSKGQDVVLCAFAILSGESNIGKAIFIGDGPERYSLERMAASLGVADRCLFLGRKSHDDVLKYMSESVGTLVPSRSEAFGLVNIESLSVGTPVIASNVGGISEIVTNDQEGILVPPDNPKQLASAIKTLLSDRPTWESMSTNARATFLQRFELEGAIRKQVAWLESITATST